MGLDELKQKVQRILTEFVGSVRVDKEGRFIVTHNSAAVYVSCWEQTGEENEEFSRLGVSFTCPLVKDIPVSNELFRHIATEHDFLFGNLIVQLYDDDRKAFILFKHSILGKDVDASEIENALSAVIYAGDELDTELHKRFGGTMYGTDRD